PRLLAKHGYYPTVIQGGSTAFDHEAEFFEKHGFQTILGKRNIAKPGTSWGIYDEHLMTTAALWLKTQKVPTFLNLYTITNHHPWIHPEKKHGFLNTFAYTDKALQILIDALADGDLLKKSILFIYGDHGQQLEDRGPHFEVNRDLYQDNIHVPLLILAEGRIDRPRTIDTLSSQVDLLPTLLDLLHIHTPHQSLGKSLLYPSNAPIFFSHPFDTPAKGCREGPWKYIVSDEKECLYHLEKDPDETVNRIVEGTSLRKKTEEFFASLDTYYSEIPPEKIECSMHLDFTNSLKMTDAMLLEIAKKHPNLSSLSLDGCLLITNQGIASFLQLCPNIEKLYLDGLDDISSAGWENLPHLVHLKAIDCPHMTLDWIQNLPSLRVLQLGASKLSDEDLQKLAKTQRNLNAIYFSNLQHITDAGLIPLLSANQNLMILSIRDCPNITKSAFEAIQSKILRYKWLA
ncbi:MAG: phosphoglycerol transferase, partial [uncultured bacterium]